MKRWIEEGLIERKKGGPKNAMVRLNRLRLEELSQSSNRNTLITTEERGQ